VIYIDSNIPMYLVGAPRPNKDEARRFLEAAIVAGERLVTSAEVLREILHRYAAIGQLDAVQPAFDAVLGLVDEVYAVEPRDVERAKDLLLGGTAASARDALHVAVMTRHRVATILSFDRRFDAFAAITRVPR
jgi:predicted nucleic acid-binding protein